MLRKKFRVKVEIMEAKNCRQRGGGGGGRNNEKFSLELGQRAHAKQCDLLSSTSASGSRKRLPPLERTEPPLFRKKNGFYLQLCERSP